VKYGKLLPIGLELFESEEALIQWLKSPAPTLKYAQPIDYLNDEEGVRRIKELLEAMARGHVL